MDAHAEFLQGRAEAVDYSAQILYQELQSRGYTGSYATVRRFVQPLREAACRADLTWTRFKTPPGQQSQVDWGQARVWFGAQAVTRHIFVLTLGYSRRSVYLPCLDETLGTFLDVHETAFEYFGGHTPEHLYDRARTVCHPPSVAHAGMRPSKRLRRTGTSNRGSVDPIGPRPRARWNRASSTSGAISCRSGVPR